MNDLTLTFERESGLVVLEGLPAGAAGEAPLVPVPGLNLAFDRADGRLCRALITTCEAGGPSTLSAGVLAMLARLFGAGGASVVADDARSSSQTSQGPCILSPRLGLARTLSRLARLDAARATSPIPPGSPWWAAEAAELAERAGLAVRARAEARRALTEMLGQLDRINTAVLSEQAINAVHRVAAINAATEPAAADRLREALGAAADERSGYPGSQLAAPPPVPIFDVAAEVENLEKDRLQLGHLHWVLDPRWVPEGLFRAGLSPHSDLTVCWDDTCGLVAVGALLAPGADCGALTRYQARLVDASSRHILAHAGFTVTQSRVTAELQLTCAGDTLREVWVEVGPDAPWPVRGAKVHRIRRALRWADAALRAERAPAALAPASAREDWAAFAAAAWERCCHDWSAAGYADHAYLAARRQAAIDPRTCVPPVPSVAAAEIARQVPVDGPAYMAEVLGS